MLASPRPAVRRFGLIVGLAASLVVASACGGGSDAQPATSTPTTSVTTGATGTPTAGASATAAESSAASTPSTTAGSSDPEALNQLEEQVTKDADLSSSSSEPDYTSYERVTHPSGKYSFEVPTDWKQENISDTDPIIQRAPDLDEFLQDFSTGIEARRFTDRSSGQMLTETAPGCGASSPVRAYDDGRFKGIVQTFSQCDGDGNAVVISVVSTADDGAFRAYFNSSYVDRRDVADLKRIISSVTYE